MVELQLGQQRDVPQPASRVAIDHMTEIQARTVVHPEFRTNKHVPR